MTPVQRKDSPAVFIGHCGEDTVLAHELRDRIAKRTGSDIKVVLSEDIPRTDDWYAEAEVRLDAANWFVLVMNTRRPGLDWSLYEAGIYQALHGDERSIACLHHSDIGVPELLKSAIVRDAEPQGIDDLVDHIVRRPLGNASRPQLGAIAS